MNLSTGAVVWMTGLSGAGKTTLARRIADKLRLVRRVELLDGDEVRAVLSRELRFSRQDRDTNVARIGYVARLLAKHGVLVFVAAISPYADARADVARLCEADGVCVYDVYVEAPLATVIARDVKGLYRKALSGEISSFTGVSDPYEAPTHPALLVRTDQLSIEESEARILEFLRGRGLA